jgi:hypothetical protein
MAFPGSSFLQDGAKNMATTISMTEKNMTVLFFIVECF